MNAGFPEEDVHVLVPDDAHHKGNLVARLRGVTPGSRHLLLGTSTVVEPARGLEPDSAIRVITKAAGYFYGAAVSEDKTGGHLTPRTSFRMRKEGFSSPDPPTSS